MDKKICTKCGIEQSLECYHKDSSHKDGLCSVCIVCRNLYYLEHQEYKKQCSKQYRIDNKDHINQYIKQYGIDNHERIAQYKKEYRANNPDKNNAIKQRRRALQNELPSTLTLKQWGTCKAYFKNRCAYCGKSMPLTREHVIALACGGGYTVDNIIPACKPCNSSKIDRALLEWYPKQIFFSKSKLRKIVLYLNRDRCGEQCSMALPESESS